MSKIINCLSNGRVAAAINLLGDCDFRPHLEGWVQSTIHAETSTMVNLKNPSILGKTSKEDLLMLTNKAIEEEIKARAPLTHIVLKSIATSKRRVKRISEGKSQDRVNPNLVMAMSVLLRARAPSLTALSYRIGFLLHHCGAKKRVSRQKN